MLFSFSSGSYTTPDLSEVFVAQSYLITKFSPSTEVVGGCDPWLIHRNHVLGSKCSNALFYFSVGPPVGTYMLRSGFSLSILASIHAVQLAKILC